MAGRMEQRHFLAEHGPSCQHWVEGFCHFILRNVPTLLSLLFFLVLSVSQYPHSLHGFGGMPTHWLGSQWSY